MATRLAVVFALAFQVVAALEFLKELLLTEGKHVKTADR